MFQTVWSPHGYLSSAISQARFISLLCTIVNEGFIWSKLFFKGHMETLFDHACI